MVTKEEIQRRRRKRLEAAAERAGGNAALAKLLEYKDGAFVGQMIRGKRPITETTILKLQAVRGYRNWFEPQLSEPISLDELKSYPPELTWGVNVSRPLPAEFRMRIPEGALAPLVPAETIVLFKTGLGPVAGDGILVEDASGTLHFRRYRAGTPGRWQAYAMNEAYRTLDSEDDHLTLLAVYSGAEIRLSEI